VRGELIHRYPNVIVYATRTTDVNALEVHPVFSGRVGSDVAFTGAADSSTCPPPRVMRTSQIVMIVLTVR